ncbi:SRB5 [Candida pseudojiufengensis]|uniref:SRB5 n=1 Tax=Candida pseudojiufengensis TaxID=497109 RepID=UPI002225AC31|nr:SRB5 [Candida pseudojiufengensis]KAI5965351.1 SRB5 [Candida pseudojiufengensis]
MVHQLSLVSSIPHSKYLQTISSLQAITGISTPTEISTYSLITQPNLIFKPKFEPGKINQIEQYFMKCTTTWIDDEGRNLDISKPILNDSKDIIVQKLFSSDNTTNTNDNERVWTLQISDIPIAGKNQQCSQQTIFESTLVHTHIGVDSEIKNKEEVVKQETNDNKSDVMEIDEDEINKQYQNLNSTEAKIRQDSFLIYLSDLGYEVINQYWIKGKKFFIMDDIIIEIYKIFVRDDSYTGDEIKLKLLDESNTFQIKSYINIKNSTDIEQINNGIKKLINLQNLIKSLFLLEVPDRMFMDSRIKSNI